MTDIPPFPFPTEVSPDELSTSGHVIPPTLDEENQIEDETTKALQKEIQFEEQEALKDSSDSDAEVIIKSQRSLNSSKILEDKSLKELEVMILASTEPVEKEKSGDKGRVE